MVLFNLSKDEYLIKKGDRVAQLVLERIFTPPVVTVEVSFYGAGLYGLVNDVLIWGR